ncbi:hypothetical protein BKA66DRAFT_447741 [Pyrenochaeta sp. MPI-SDFR-AT-0127]|nr:hypothetical protein BKA66DRAFT_447741 [Pyrenochaeta sp. MPI-SDFR-AT-0127]
MLEARQARSWATGRNGGHIRPSSYAEYDSAKGGEEAAKITRLRSAHVKALISAANELDDEGREASEARVVNSIYTFFDQAGYPKAVKRSGSLFSQTIIVIELMSTLSLLWETIGMITGNPIVAGAIWPYRFITHSFKSVLQKHPSFSVDPNTPVLNVSSIDTANATFQVTTSRGKIQALHVIHVANAWIPHLIPGLETKISSSRLHMRAQVGGAGIPKAGEWPSYSENRSLSTSRAWSLYREFMFGGGGGGGGSESGPDTTNVDTDDSLPPHHSTVAYLGGALPNYFGYDKRGSERTGFPSRDNPSIFPGRTRRVAIRRCRVGFLCRPSSRRRG